MLYINHGKEVYMANILPEPKSEEICSRYTPSHRRGVYLTANFLSGSMIREIHHLTMVQSSCMICQQEHNLCCISELRGTKVLQMYIQAMKYTWYKVQVNQFLPLHHDFKHHFLVQSLLVLLHNVFCQQTLQLLVTERAWPVPFPMCTKHLAQMLQSSDIPGPQVYHTTPQLRSPHIHNKLWFLGTLLQHRFCLSSLFPSIHPWDPHSLLHSYQRVGRLCRNGADAQYIQAVRHKHAKSLFKSAFVISKTHISGQKPRGRVKQKSVR